MGLKLDVTVFNRLKPNFEIKLGKWKKESIPGYTTNPLQAVMRFAKYMGMRVIPARTVEKLRTDPYFRYCFYKFAKSDIIYDPVIGKTVRERLVNILKDPDSFTDKDLFEGLLQYLNNFVHNLPGGYKRDFFEGEPMGDRRIIAAVDKVLDEKGITPEHIADLQAKITEEEENELFDPDEASYAKRAELMKLCLDIFNTLVEKYKFNPNALWI